MAAAVARRAEIKTRTTDEVKRSATEVYARFDYASGSGYKYRPVIVLATRHDGSLVGTSANEKVVGESSDAGCCGTAATLTMV